MCRLITLLLLDSQTNTSNRNDPKQYTYVFIGCKTEKYKNNSMCAGKQEKNLVDYFTKNFQASNHASERQTYMWVPKMLIKAVVIPNAWKNMPN